jgi:hypothetical protein
VSKKLLYLVSFLLVLDLVLTSVASAVDPDLVGHWKFDDGSDTTAFDSSGKGNDGTLIGGAQWVEGQLGGALEFNGQNARVDAPYIPLDSRSFTITMWVNPVLYTGEQIVFSQVQTNATNTSLHFRIYGPGSGRVRMGFYNNDLDTSGNTIQENNWYHIAFWYDFENQNRRIYVNGVQEAEAAATPYLGTSGNTVIGSWGTSQWFQGIIDDVRIYTRVLTETEILGVMAGGGAEYPLASRPDPSDGALHADTWVNISWRAGDFAVSHDVYFGDNFDDVNDGAEGVFQGNQASTYFVAGFPGFPYPEGLVPGTTYYWRINEVNDAEPNNPWKGDVWSFTVPPRTAYDPIPADGVKFVDPNEDLSWTVGFGAKLHTVYFGDNFDDVNNAAGGLPQGSTTYTLDTLEFDKYYYWRVDEFDAVTTHKGDVWSFKTLPDIPITDPNLVGWWKLDEGTGSTVIDWSGHGNFGRINGDPQGVAGYDGDALEFDGRGDYVNCGNSPSLTITGDITFMCWIKVAAFSKTWETILAKGDDSYRMSRGPGTGDSIHFGCNGPSGGNLNATTIVTDDTWHHAALMYNGTTQIIYIDGAEDARQASTGSINVSSYDFCIGENLDATGRHLTGLVDDVRIYNRALSLEEIQQAMRGDTSLAWNPSPSNGSTPDIDEVMPLSWSAGENASGHDIYFGIDKDAVADADTSDTTGIYQGRQGVTSYTPTEGVEWGGGPYYWRIDEYNTDGTISTGRTWRFSVADYLIVDDFEDYDVGNNEIWWAWIDGLGYASHPTLPAHPGNGTGSMVGDETTGSYMEETIIHGGGKSMPLFYDNNLQGKLRYSEVEKTLSSRRDWTAEGVGVLSIWFQGVASNAAEPMYVALNGNAVVTHDNPNAAQIETWTQWTIDLQAFAEKGVNLANVNTIAIGLGNKKNPVAGGSGTMYFDDIRLYRPAP